MGKPFWHFHSIRRKLLHLLYEMRSSLCTLHAMTLLWWEMLCGISYVSCKNWFYLVIKAVSKRGLNKGPTQCSADTPGAGDTAFPKPKPNPIEANDPEIKLKCPFCVQCAISVWVKCLQCAEKTPKNCCLINHRLVANLLTYYINISWDFTIIHTFG